MPPKISVEELVPAVAATAAPDVDTDDDDDTAAEAKGSATRDKIEFKTVIPSCNFFTSDAPIGVDITEIPFLSAFAHSAER